MFGAVMALILAGGFAAGPAQAAGARAEVVQTAGTLSKTGDEFTVLCPAGSKTLKQTWALTLQPSTALQSSVIQAEYLPDGAGYTVRAVDWHESAPVDITAIIDCRTPGDFDTSGEWSQYHLHASVTAPTGGGTVTATCPAGTLYQRIGRVSGVDSLQRWEYEHIYTADPASQTVTICPDAVLPSPGIVTLKIECA
ncbi:hypothetical protein [Streptomyces sp. S.PB5]|uniref:hypothetical protein n=1 Tax=Streptomyces sp. S.PB5 TaxID=3020844 RepID=UPI0025B25509|nr:hypothetical protein [Streptomyces sp. S.PB5]MDN3027202.1 hypothetical protein [Streptomyces sp. S.PB5]